MSETPQSPETGPVPGARYALLVALASATMFAALVVAVFGFISLGTDSDVIPAGVASPTGGIMLLAATLVVATGLSSWAVRRAVERRRGRRQIPVPLLLGAGLAVGAGAIYLLLGALLRAAELDDLAAGVSFALERLATPYPYALMGCALLVVLAAATVIEVSGPNPRRPRWPWEDAVT